MSDTSSPTYPVKTIAALFRLTERRVQQLSKEGVIPRAERGRYALAPTIQGYIAYLQARAAPRVGTGAPAQLDYHAEKARKTRADADKAEMEAARLRGDLVEALEVKAALERVISEVNSRLLNTAPTRIAARAKSQKGVAAIKAIAREEIAEALEALSQMEAVDLLGGNDGA